jgi:maleylacetate reductase
LSAEEAPDFIWRDAGRTVIFRRGALGAARELLAEHSFGEIELLSTERALAEAPALAGAAAATHIVPRGLVPEAAASILPSIGSARLVALGGGRVIDTAKAIGAVNGASVAAIPTTLSGAEMTGIHRLPAGREGRAPIRPHFVIADPEAMTSQPEPRLRASAMNALAHGADSLYTPLANPVSEMTALRGASMIATALDQGRERRDRAALALGSVLCGYAIDSALFALHHVVCQTLVWTLAVPHAETNAAILPRAMVAMRARAPRQLDALAEALGAEPAWIEERILGLGGQPAGLGELGADPGRIEDALDRILARPELGLTPEPPGREELRRLIESAW